MGGTVPSARSVIAVRAISVEVLAGPHAGARTSVHEEALAIGTADDNALCLSGDRSVSRYHVELSPASGGVRARDLGSTNGTRAGVIRIADAILPLGSVISVGKSAIRIGDGGTRSIAIDADAEPIPSLIGSSPPAQLLARRVRRAARAGSAVLLEGESGTGKERIAAALHALSPRAAGPLAIVDCGALAPGLVASELFGHVRGAFTGAREAREGALSRAHGGTIFLDEIGELPPALQPTLLGALGRGVVRPVGGDRDLPADVRVISASHRDLRAAVNDGSFRADLYHRLAVIRIAVPPLRARPDDVPALVEHFLEAEGMRGARAEVIPDDVLERWCAHPWPGNVRELRNAVQAALAMREPPELEPPIARGPFAEVLALPFRQARDRTFDRFERRYLEALLDRARQNVAEAAREAGIDRTHLHDLLKRHGLR